MKHIPAALKIALKALRTNKMRSALTMLGMVVGVGAVIAMVAVGQGASEKVQSADRIPGQQSDRHPAGL